MKCRESTLRRVLVVLVLTASALLAGCSVGVGTFSGNVTVKEGYYPPFIKAAQMGDIAEADRLLRSGQMVNQTTIGNQTALHLAAIEGQDQMVEWLISHEANPLAQDQNGKTPAAFARERGKLSSEKLIAELLQQYQKEDTAFRGKNFALLKELMAKDPRHYTLLHVLAQAGLTEEAVKEIHAGSDVNARTALEMTPLHKAVENGDLEIAKALVKAGADVNAVDVSNETPLYIAAGLGKKELVIFLLASGADRNIKARSGSSNTTPLGIAKGFGHQEIIKLLQK